MTEEERQAHATRLLREVLADPEFCYVYEDEELADFEDEWIAIHKLMRTARVKIDFS